MENIKITKLQIAYLNKILETKKPYQINFDKYEVVISPKVFPPYCDNQLILDNVNFEKDDNVLDICSGCGLLSIHAGHLVKMVIATDINPDSVKNIKLNIKKYNLHHKIKVMQADVYPKNTKTKFDKILAIPPYTDKKAKSVIERSVWDYQHHVLHKIFSELENKLTKTGALYLVWSSIGGFEIIFKLNKQYKYKISEIAWMSDAVSIYKLFKITAN